MNKIYWRYKHLVTGKSHSLGTNEKKLQLHIVQEKLEAK
ncbi:phage integrase Arm DNA-binding domain-containing protein [Salmonella bongori serovar 40:z35:-]|nr:phage integrase Arm DNA-binding domain-containing protein [Salmonella bongori serovar 40:z35:-]